MGLWRSILNPKSQPFLNTLFHIEAGDFFFQAFCLPGYFIVALIVCIISNQIPSRAELTLGYSLKDMDKAKIISLLVKSVK